MFRRTDRETREYVIVATTDDGRSAIAWTGQASQRNAQRMTNRLAAECIGAQVAAASPMWNLGLNPDAKVTGITLKGGA